MDQKRKPFFFQSTEQKKWWQFRKMDRREYGYTAVVGWLGGYIIGGVVGEVLALAGFVCGVVWIVLTIQEKLRNRKSAIA